MPTEVAPIARDLDHGLAAAKASALEAVASLNTKVKPPSGSATDRRRRRRSKRRSRAPSVGTSHHVPLHNRESESRIGSPNSHAETNDSDVDYALGNSAIPEELQEFSAVLQRFNESRVDASDVTDQIVNSSQPSAQSEARTDSAEAVDSHEKEHAESDSESEEDANTCEIHLSERQRRRRSRLTVAQLKSVVSHPEVVEQWDVTADDPLLLIFLKAWPGSVQVPVNWRQKRKYLQCKRGMEKLPFKLPLYIEDTGIGTARDAVAESEASKTAKQKARERIRPKSSGKAIDVDYSVFRDAFFKFQTKPTLTSHGDLYYELREREVNCDEFKPGRLGTKLREALGMSDKDAPPWLVAMQRYGPPPSYPNLVIPGLNAPIPAGASFGYKNGEWGKPPVDMNGCPLYGDVFGEGLQFKRKDSRFDFSDEQKEWLWGEPRKSIYDEEEEEEEEIDGRHDRDSVHVRHEAKQHESESNESNLGDSRIEVHSDRVADEEDSKLAHGVSSVPLGVETPADGVELRKGIASGALYEVLQQESVSVGKGDILGSSYRYKLGHNEQGDSAIVSGENHSLNPLDVAKPKDEDSMKKRKWENIDEKPDSRTSKRSRDFKF